jgi:diacylglycerol kinase family enzyme
MSILVVYNPISRLARADLDQHLLRHFADQSVQVIETREEETIQHVLAPHLREADMVVAVGGDGTVSGAAAAVLGSSIPLGIVPAGSTNMLARMNRVPLDVDAAIALLAGEHALEAIDAGVSGDRVLLHLGGAGLDARIFQRSSSNLKRRLRWLGYGPPAIQSLRDSASEVCVTVDGVTVNVRSRMILVANAGSLIHPSFTIVPTESRSDGRFEIAIFTADNLKEIARSISDLTILRSRESPHIIRLAGSEVSVSADPPLPFEFDGDVIGETPFALEVRQKAVVMICGG